MTHHAEGLSERPGRDGVGREPLVVEGDAGLKIRVLKIAVKGAEGGGHGESLIANKTAGKGGDVKGCLGLELAFDFTADQEEESLKVIGIDISRAADEKVDDLRLGEAGEFAKFVGIHGHFTPSEEGDLPAGENGLGKRSDISGNSFREKKDTDAKVSRVAGEAEPGGDFSKKGKGNLAKDTGAIAGFHIRVDRAPVSHVADRSQGIVDDVV